MKLVFLTVNGRVSNMSLNRTPSDQVHAPRRVQSREQSPVESEQEVNDS